MATDPRLQLQTKLRLYQTCILSILLYGSETWTLLQEDLRKLEVFHMRSQRILGIRWHELSETQKLSTGPTFPCVQDIIAKRRNSLFGHVVRLDDHTPAHRALSQVAAARINWPPFWSWLATTARTPAPFIDPADRRRYTLQHSCRMVQGSSSWPL